MSDERHQVIAVDDHLDVPASVPALSYDDDDKMIRMMIMMRRRKRKRTMRGDISDERHQVLAVKDHLDVTASVPALSHDDDDGMMMRMMMMRMMMMRRRMMMITHL